MGDVNTSVTEIESTQTEPAPNSPEARHALFAALIDEEEKGDEVQENEAAEPDDADEGSDDESEQETEDEGSDDEEETEDSTTNDDAVVELPDGSTLTVAEIKELKANGIRQADYTRKTQALAEKVKATEAQMQELAKQEQHIQTTSKQLLHILQSKLPPMPTAELAFTDSAAYLQQKVVHEAAIAEIQELTAVQNKLHQEALEKFNKERAAAIDHAAATLREKFPELRDAKKAPQFINAIAGVVNEYGFSEDEFKETLDPRMWEVLRDIVKYKAMIAKQPEIQKTIAKTPTLKANARQSTDITTEYKNDLNRAIKQGDKGARLRLMSHLLEE